MDYSEEAAAQPPVKVESLNPRSRQLNLTVKVVSKGEVRETVSRRDGSAHRVADVLVGDETGSVYMTLWDDNIDKVKEGDVIDVKNGYVSLFRGSMRLNVGRFGSFEASAGTVGEVNEKNNLSEKTYEEERRYFRPRFEDRGGYEGRGRGRGYRGRRGRF